MSNLDARTFPWPSGLVAAWDFREVGSASLTSVAGGSFTALLLAGGTLETSGAEPGPFGPSLVLDGETCFAVPSAQIGALDVAQTTGHVTVIAWVRDTGTAIGFRAGSHREGSTSPARQYGLYGDAAFYGGDRRVCPHIGAQDGPTPGYPFNRDYACSARQYTVPGWRMEAMTYDGQEIIAYLDGIADSYTGYTEPPPDPGYSTQVTVDKNPFPLNKAMNNSATGKTFSIGAATNGTASAPTAINGMIGNLGGVAVFNRALTAAEVMAVHLAALTTTPYIAGATGPHTADPILILDAGNAVTGATTCRSIGWRSYRGTPILVDTSDLASSGNSGFFAQGTSGTGVDYIARTSSSATPAVATFELVDDVLDASDLARVTFEMRNSATGAEVRLVVKIDDRWYATNTAYTCATAFGSGAPWSGAERFSVDMSLAAGVWRELTMAGTLELAATATGAVADGPLRAVGVFSPSGAAGSVRLSNLEAWAVEPAASLAVSMDNNSGWYSLKAVMDSARQEYEQPRPENDCSHDGVTLRVGHDGTLYCPFSGHRFPGGRPAS